ncbi:hypothetical protein VE01_05426 [Pseudogymnoascus verrucosus]|uniref:GPI anchored protein n=1 Tax=Pseudogymnoascus verrucosus TaxID=342668 RepID=A0A1B8GM16_9PEZI|nr:uncharacterized protein VE01_05426 [Pseudogymnoascus verrucosus]OBT96880.1 hypothetical protein VE01_05426 [Pseudogymnoascus verrucosus]
MHLTNLLLALPPSLLLLSSHATSAHAHSNGAALPPPAHMPEPQVIQRRQEIAARIEGGAKPVRVRKMSEDGGEMFFGEYWGFDARDEEGGDVLRRDYESEDDISRGNSSATFSFRPAFAIHEAESSSPRGLSEAQALHHRSSRALSALLKRAFQCPTGTTACTSISQPNYCCASTESCITITDTGLGPVGCCASGQTCEGEITHCAAGQTACPQSLGGACCVAGFVCFDVGCVSSVVVTEITTVTQTPVVVPTTTSTPVTTTTTTTPSTSAVTTTEGPAPPVRGTGESSTVAPPTTSLTSDSEACPTGFYACSAYFPGAGCCRVGRDCAQTFCPTTGSVTVISGGVTVAVPEGSAATTATGAGKCASGWDGCVGGGCCPGGWECGVSCVSVGAAATSVLAKGAENAGGRGGGGGVGGWGVVVAVLGILVG